MFFCVSLLKACALQFLHERNISHLDLKPQNILLCGSVLKLAGDLMSSQTQMISGDVLSGLCGSRVEPSSFCCLRTDCSGCIDGCLAVRLIVVCKSADCSLVCAQILALPSTCLHGMSTASSEAPPFTWPRRWCVGASMIPG